MYRYLFFDADNTIFDFSKAEHLALIELFTKYDIPTTDEMLSSYIKINEECWRELEKGRLDDERLKTERFVRFFNANGIKAAPERAGIDQLDLLSTHGDLLPYAKETLLKLKDRGYHLYIITNGYTSVQNGRIDDAAIRDLFEGIFISGQIGYSKPDKRFFDAVEKQVKCDKKEALIIGDSLSSDIQLGLNVGIDTCFLDLKGTCTSDKPKYIIHSLPEVFSLLDR